MTSLDKPTEETTEADDARAVTEAALFEAFGGVRGMIETVLPGLLFVTIFTLNNDRPAHVPHQILQGPVRAGRHGGGQLRTGGDHGPEPAHLVNDFFAVPVVCEECHAVTLRAQRSLRNA